MRSWPQLLVTLAGVIMLVVAAGLANMVLGGAVPADSGAGRTGAANTASATQVAQAGASSTLGTRSPLAPATPTAIPPLGRSSPASPSGLPGLPSVGTSVAAASTPVRTAPAGPSTAGSGGPAPPSSGASVAGGSNSIPLLVSPPAAAAAAPAAPTPASGQSGPAGSPIFSGDAQSGAGTAPVASAGTQTDMAGSPILLPTPTPSGVPTIYTGAPSTGQTGGGSFSSSQAPTPTPRPTNTAVTVPTATSGPVTPACPTPITVIPPTGTVMLTLLPSSCSIRTNDIFFVEIQVAAGSTTVDGVSAFVSYDSARLALVDANGSAAASLAKCSPPGPLDTDLPSPASPGSIAYSAGKLSGTLPSGTFCLARAYFKALAPGAVPLTFASTMPRKSDATSGGRSVIANSLPSTMITVQ